MNKRRRLRLILIGLVSLCFVFYLLVAGRNAYAEAVSWAHPHRAPICCTPADAELTYENVSFTTQDNITLKGWYIPGTNGAAILLIHGIHGNREDIFQVGYRLHEHGYGVLLFDVRGHSESGGEILNHLEYDGMAAAAYLREQPNVEHVGAWGFSLGGLMVLQAAAQTDAIEAVVADGAGPSRLSDMPPRTAVIDWLYLPYDLVFFPALEAQTGGFSTLSTTEAAAKIAPRPLLLIATDQALELPMVQGLYNAAGEPKDLWHIAGVWHGGGFNDEHIDGYEERIVTFFDEALLQ